MEAEQLPRELDVRILRTDKVEPEELIAREEFDNPGFVDGREDGMRHAPGLSRQRQTDCFARAALRKALPVPDWIFGLGSALNRRIHPSPPQLGRPLANPPRNPDPVVLVGGYASDDPSWDAWRRSLERDGFRVFVFDVPHHGVGEIRASARELAAFVEKVKRVTGRDHVDLIAHSAGGIVSRSYLDLDDGARNVDAFITLATPHHGVDWGRAAAALLYHLPMHLLLGDASRQLWAGSSLLKQLGSHYDHAVRARTTSISMEGFDGLLYPTNTAILEGARNLRIPMPPGGWLALNHAGLGHFILHRMSPVVYDLAREALLRTP
jgi:hypothetical protein